jgi:two-component system, OmpR family, response regulator
MIRKQSPGEVLKVLFIEDDERLAEVYRLRLELDGYRVTVAHSQVQALRILSSHVPDLIFLDVTVPDMNACEVLHFLRHDAQTRYVPIIILSPEGSQEVLRAGLALQSHDHMLRIEREPGGKVLIGPWCRSRPRSGRGA